MLTLLVTTTAILAVVMNRPAPHAVVASAPNLDEAILRRTIDSIEINDMPAEAAVGMLREKTGADIRVAWESFEKADPPFVRTKFVTLSLQNTTLAEALYWVFHFNSSHYVMLNAFGNAVDVSASGALSSQLTVRAYDVRDLISDEYWGVKIPAAEQTPAQDQRMNNLVNILTAYVEHGEWDPLFTAASRGGRMEALGGRLIVTQSTIGHERVANLLAWLRKLR